MAKEKFEERLWQYREPSDLEQAIGDHRFTDPPAARRFLKALKAQEKSKRQRGHESLQRKKTRAAQKQASAAEELAKHTADQTEAFHRMVAAYERLNDQIDRALDTNRKALWVAVFAALAALASATASAIAILH